MEGIDNTLPTFESLGLSKKQTLEKQTLGQEDFMKLMMAQMKHQDPMKPMENGEFISQMAQFSSVKGLKDIKDSFNTLANALQSSQALQASSMVGRKVLVPGNATELAADGVLRGAVEIPASSESVTVKIFNKAGEQVHAIDLGARTKGSIQFKWDGTVNGGAMKNNPAPEAISAVQPAMDPAMESVRTYMAEPGVYTIKAEANIDGEIQSVDTFVVDKVDSVSLAKDNQGVTLNLNNSGATLLSKVQEII